jgi:hypothetical protein
LGAGQLFSEESQMIQTVKELREKGVSDFLVEKYGNLEKNAGRAFGARLPLLLANRNK